MQQRFIHDYSKIVFLLVATCAVFLHFVLIVLLGSVKITPLMIGKSEWDSIERNKEEISAEQVDERNKELALLFQMLQEDKSTESILPPIATSYEKAEFN